MFMIESSRSLLMFIVARVMFIPLHQTPNVKVNKVDFKWGDIILLMHCIATAHLVY